MVNVQIFDKKHPFDRPLSRGVLLIESSGARTDSAGRGVGLAPPILRAPRYRF